MGISLRKAFKLGKKSRINVSSSSGFGVSTGVKGARISLNKNGIRLSGGKGILRVTKNFSFKKVLKLLKLKS